MENPNLGRGAAGTRDFERGGRRGMVETRLWHQQGELKMLLKMGRNLEVLFQEEESSGGACGDGESTAEIIPRSGRGLRVKSSGCVFGSQGKLLGVDFGDGEKFKAVVETRRAFGTVFGGWESLGDVLPRWGVLEMYFWRQGEPWGHLSGAGESPGDILPR